MENLRVFPHVEQIKGPNDWSCGAASLAMLYTYYGIQSKHDAIWNRVQMRNPIDQRERICKTTLMAQDAKNWGFRCTIFSVFDAGSVFKKCADQQLEVIFLYRQYPQAITGHFVLLTNVVDDCIYINDPFYSDHDGVNIKIVTKTLPLLMQPRDSGATEYSGQNVILAFGKPNEKIRVKASECPYCKEETFEMRPVLEIADMIMCPNCGKRYSVNR